MSRFIIYALHAPGDEEIRYVGKSIQGLKRPKNVLAAPSNIQKHNPELHAWVQSLGLACKDRPSAIKILQSLDAHYWLFVREKEWIRKLANDGHRIFNKIGHPKFCNWYLDEKGQLRTKPKNDPTIWLP